MSEPIKDFQLEQAIGLNVNRTAFLMSRGDCRKVLEP